jgi:hypothetical protein
MKVHGVFVVLPIIILAACNLPRQGPEPTINPDLVATIVEATLAGFASPTVNGTATVPSIPSSTAMPTSQPTRTPTLSKASGKVCFPKSGRIDLRGFFQEINRGTVTELAIPAGSNDYEITLDPGKYIAYVWLQDFSKSGMYSTSNVPTPFDVVAGQTTPAIDLCDWSHGPFDVPYPPGYQPQQTTGTVSGEIAYPYGAIPQLTIVAFSKTTSYWYWVGTGSGQSFYSIGDLPAGDYQVVAYDGSGHSGGSNMISVKAGQTTAANINDWGGSFPANPVK